MRLSLRPLLIAALCGSATATLTSPAHAKSWDYCPGDCPDPEVSAEVSQSRDGSCTVAVTMVTPASMFIGAEGGYDPIVLTDVDALPDIYEVLGTSTSQILFDEDSEDLLVPANVYAVIDPDEDGFDPAYADFGSVVLHTTTLTALPGDAGSVYSLGFPWADVVAWSDFYSSGGTGPAPSLPTGDVLDSTEWFCPFPAWEGDHELEVEAVPNGDGTCTLEASVTVLGVNESSADMDEFELLVDDGSSLSGLALEGSYVDVSGGLYSLSGDLVVEDGEAGSAELVFADLDTTTPVSQLVASADWSCEACPELQADLNGDGLVSMTDLLAFMGVYGSADAAADFNGNGMVDTDDMLTLLAEFGATGC